MKKEEVRKIRQQLRIYYDRLKTRAEELEEEHPVYRAVFDPINLFFGLSPYYYVFDSYKLRAPHAIRNALKNCEIDLKQWSVLEGNDKRLNPDIHIEEIEETE